MRQKTKHVEVRIVLRTITFVTRFIDVSISLFHWVEQTRIQHLLDEYSRYIFGFRGFVAMIFGTMLVKYSSVLRDVFKRKYELPALFANQYRVRGVNYPAR